MRQVRRLARVPVLACALACGSDGEPAQGGGDGGTAPLQFGAHWDPSSDAIVFRVASTRATRLELWIYGDPLGQPERLRLEMAREGDGPVFARRVSRTELAAADLEETLYYGYRVWGPNWPYDPEWTPGSLAGYQVDVDDAGNRMNPNKLVFDPYARELSHDPTNERHRDGSVYRVGDEGRGVDSGPFAPKGIVLRPEAPADVGVRPTRPLADDVIYEVHVRGLTAARGDLGECAGTYAGAAAVAAELAALGVTAVELLPIQETWNDGNDIDPESSAGDNYWGYSTLAWFAPDRRYACDRSPGGPTRELREMVRAFHEYDLKVFVDVVYNHTAEGSGGSLLSWRGLDNAGYYELSDDGRGFANHNGVGADVNAASSLAQDLVIASLRYLKEDLGVDGFRFDLAPLLGNSCERGCFDFEPGADGNLLGRIAAELPARPWSGGAGADLIAEPWGVTAGTYQLGHFPGGWAEWNGQYRDTVRADQNLLGVEAVTLRSLRRRLAGSPDLFADDGRPPAASVNYLVSHDGFTLRDLYACNEKQNGQPWPYGPSSGGEDHNRSWDQTGDPARQRQAARTGLALLFLSAGTPMITGGDEMLRSQRCNNNPYNLDSPAIWLDLALRTDNAAFLTFTTRLLAFRRAHPALRPARWPGDELLSWHGADGEVLDAGALDDPGQHVIGMRLEAGALGDPAHTLYVVYNGAAADAMVTLPSPAGGNAWYRHADTAAWMEPEGNFVAAGEAHPMGGRAYQLHRRSLAVFVEAPLP